MICKINIQTSKARLLDLKGLNLYSRLPVMLKYYLALKTQCDR